MLWYDDVVEDIEGWLCVLVGVKAGGEAGAEDEDVEAESC